MSGAATGRAGAAGRHNRASRLRVFEFGEHRLTYLPDGYVQLHPRAWFPESTADHWHDKGSYLDEEGYLIGSVGGLLVEHGEQALLIDSGFGPHRIPADRTIPPLGRIEGGELPASLAAVGRTFASIGTVAFTHLHDDHVGWAFGRSESGGPLLEKAAFVASAEEWRAGGVPLGQVVAARDGDEIFPGVTAMATPGHTGGHTSYVVASGGKRVIVIGDVLHSPLQVSRPQWRAASDTDPSEGARSRKLLLDELARPGTFGFGGHFADVVFGEVVEGAGGRRWEPLH